MTERFGRPGEFGHPKPASAAWSVQELEARYGAVIERYEDRDYEAVQLADGRIYSRLGRGCWLALADYARNRRETRWARFLKDIAA